VEKVGGYADAFSHEQALRQPVLRGRSYFPCPVLSAILANTTSSSAASASSGTAMLATFFVLNAPVNQAVNGWTSASLPNDWPAYRMRWEIGHALAALMAIIALAAVLRAHFAETSTRGCTT